MAGPLARTPERPVPVQGAGLSLRPYADSDVADLLLAFADPEHKIDWDQGDAEVGYWVAPWARGVGLAGRAVTAAAAYAFGELSLHRLYLFHAVDNPGSCRVADAAGFPLEGVLRQSYRYRNGEYHDEHLHARLATDPR